VNPGLSPKARTVFSIGESVFENLVHPLFQNRGRAVPIKRVLEDDDVVAEEEILFLSDVDNEVGIGLVKFVNGDPRKPSSLFEKLPIHS
jgi:hypothetical protein